MSEPLNESRARILARIRAGLQTNRHLLDAQSRPYQPPHPRGPFVPTDLGLVQQFEAELTALHGHVHICEGPAQAVAEVVQRLQAAQVEQVLSWAVAELPVTGLELALQRAGIRLVEEQTLGQDRHAILAQLDPPRGGITGADIAIAESGTLLLLSGPGRGRLASLLPPVHIALLPAERIVRSLPEAFDRLAEHYGDGIYRDSSNLTLISGPSRTGDIELSLTLGVHGPSEIHVVVIC